MKFNEQWLREWVNPKVTAAKLAEQLTLAGLEVAEVIPVAKDFSGVVVGEILRVDRHPNADKLTICQVNINTANPLTIVCGAKNVRENLKVPVAVVGAVLPKNFKINTAKLRGIESFGMMCSAVELGLAETSSGLFELPNDAPLGVDLRDYLKLNDNIFTIELTANRGDCLSIIGIAREVAAINQCEKKAVKMPKIVATEQGFPVKISALEFCPNYCGRIIRQINNRATTPLWLQEKLRRCGLRSISPVVDVTNYVMLELGQPLHAFDLKLLDKKIEVRCACDRETLTLLDGKTITLDSNKVVIADASKVLALAGVMGGSESAVTATTTDIFLESAFFAPEKISGCARLVGLQTDSSQRFERGVDPQLQLVALARVTELLLQIVGGTPSKITQVTQEKFLPTPKKISLTPKNLMAKLGASVSAKDVTAILNHLEIRNTKAGANWKITAPSWRFDITITEDIIEEIARIIGYQKFPEQEIIAKLTPVKLNNVQRKLIYHTLTTLGYSEAITYSFVDPKLQALLNPEAQNLNLVNPISPEMAVMRNNLFVGLMHAALHNLQRQQNRLRLFELGLKFVMQDGKLQQISTLAGIAVGSAYPEQWGIKSKPLDYFDIKNDVANLLDALGYTKVEYHSCTNLALHPKRSAKIVIGGKDIGYFGEIHPNIKQILEITAPLSLFEIDISLLNNALNSKFKPFSIYPSMQRDIAIVVAKEVTWLDIKQKILDFSDELLQNVVCFDIYQGEGIGLDKKSIAIHLVFQNLDCTLTDTEVDNRLNQIITALQSAFNAILRG